MKSISINSSSFIPEIRLTSMDFETYIDLLTGKLLLAILVFFAFIACMYIFFVVIQYSIFFLKYLKDSKPEKQKIIQEHPIENLVI